MSTCNDLVYLESGEPNVKSVIVDRQKNFLTKMRNNNNYVSMTIELAVRTRCPMGKRIDCLDRLPTYNREKFLKDTRTIVSQSVSSRRITYRTLHPSLQPARYLNQSNIKEHHRIAMTRLRLGSHYLRIETGRWARIPPERRSCSCQTGIQDEYHVLLQCYSEPEPKDTI